MYHCPVNKTVYIFSLWLFGSGKCVGQMCVCVCVGVCARVCMCVCGEGVVGLRAEKMCVSVLSLKCGRLCCPRRPRYLSVRVCVQGCVCVRSVCT